ncbi:heme peroxidase [Rhizophagus irregularis]|uniref:Heme peroxidase n=1 Tax=Rhizophagus irregularis TaxID=588596 RepID=A0A2N0PKX1_9GLOM|nr:heme peroxidase [Rhizophagus irregularis]
MIIKNKLFKFLSYLLFTFLLITTTICIEYRSINGEGNNRNKPSAGISDTPFARDVPSTSFFADANNNLIVTPGNYLDVPKTLFTCDANLPEGTFPLPRCVSNKVMSKQSKDDDMFNTTLLEKYKSKRRISHMLTYWGLFVKMDVSSGFDVGQNFPKGVYIPQDDQLYLSSNRNGIKPKDITFFPGGTLEFNRSVADGGNTGINEPSIFVDGSTVYGNRDADLRKIRDYNNNGKMILIKESTPDGAFGYPPVDVNGDFIYGYSAEFGRNVFTDFFHILFVREHNRLCDELFAIHGNSWDDETYFQEARRWVIAFLQKITYYEYLGTALGTPLPKYDGYKPEITPSVDTFFSTVTYRYGHSELSDFHEIVDGQGEPLTTLSLNDLQNSQLIKVYGSSSIALSLALQRQEEVDIYSADLVRFYFHASRWMDISSLDNIRGRDHGVPLYNDARQAFGLARKKSFAEISSDPDVQKRLQDTYTTVDRVEALMGGLAEDHVNGGNLGELFYKSFSEQWVKIRAADRFWYENADAGFSKEDIAKIQITTLLDIIKRNTPDSYYPQNLWFVQSFNSAGPSDGANNGYNSPLSLSDDYNIQWKMDSTNITFQITMRSTNAWFALGFNPNGNGMTDTDMMIFWNENNSVTGKNFKGIGLGIVPMQLGNDDQIITIISQKVEGGTTSLEVTRPINNKNRKSLDGNIEMVHAWNPNSNILTYHGGNRGKRTINFRTGASTDLTDNRPGLLRMHGIAMFIIWGVLFPCSIWIVRYLRHIDSYMVQHRNLNLFGGMVIAVFAAVALTATSTHGTSSHAVVGITIITITAIQVSLGILAIWSLEHVESASTGIVRYLKHFHFYLGTALLLTAWANIFLGMITYDQKFGGNRGENRGYIWAYTVWLILFGFAITASEFYYKIKNMQFLWPVKESDDLTKRIRKCIPDEVFETLPVVTWEEFNKRIMTGANLVVAEGLIFDIHRWIPLHPGGQKILQRVIGTDITNDFFFDPIVRTVIQNSLKEEYNVKEPSIPLLTDDTYKENRESYTKSKPYSVANAVDRINATAFKNRRVAMHSHSKFATSKLASMVIARIVGDDNSSNQNNSEKALIPQPPPYSPYIFRRYILTNIEIVTRPNALNVVKKLTFQVIHPNDKLPKFLPGDYIEIMSYNNNHVIIRPYTPLQGPTETSFCILVKIYKDGVMTQHLNKQLKNFEVKVRGPFDIADRMTTNYQAPSTTLEPPNTLTRPSSPMISSFGFNGLDYMIRPNNFSTYFQYENHHKGYSISNSNESNNNVILGDRTGVLLNKEREDLCWDCLFMVCGGTGITPMIQMIQYHMEKATSSNSNFSLYLLAAFDKIEDLIYPKYIDYLCQSLNGKLEVKYILFKPPAVWRDYSGLIDDALIYDWISERYSVPPPAVPPKFSNYGIGNGSTSNLVDNSYYNPNIIINNIQDVDYDPNYIVSSPSLVPISNNNSMYQSEDQQQLIYNQAYPSYSSPPQLANLSDAAANQILLMNERHNYMKLFARDTSKRVRLIVCGTNQFNENIRLSLDKIGFPINEKALFIA